MRRPFVAAGMEKRRELPGLPVAAADVGAFRRVAPEATQGQVPRDGRPFMFPGNDVIDLERPLLVEFLRELAVLAPAARAPPDQPSQGRINLVLQDTFGFRGFT